MPQIPQLLLDELMDAIENHQTDSLHHIIEQINTQSYDINTSDDKKATALHFALHKNNDVALTALLAVPGIDVNKPNNSYYIYGGPSPLQTAIQTRNEIAVEKLLAVSNIDVNYSYPEWGTYKSALQLAMEMQQQNILTRLLAADTVPSIKKILNSLEILIPTNRVYSDPEILRLLLNRLVSIEEVARLFIKKREELLLEKNQEQDEIKKIDSRSEKIIFNLTSSNLRFFQDHPTRSDDLSAPIEVLVEIANYLTTFDIPQFDEASRTLRKVAAQAGDETSQRIVSTYETNPQNLSNRRRSV